jgi:hypothetical protein
MSTKKLSWKGGLHERSQNPAAPVLTIIHIRRDPSSRIPWLMRSCNCERRVESLSLAMEAAGLAAAVAGRMGREVRIRLHRSAGRSKTFTVRELNARTRSATATATAPSYAAVCI